MSVLIKGVKMPKGCYDCPCCSAPMRDVCGNLHYSCTLQFNGLYGRSITKNVYREEEPRPNVCPLIEVPPHGDLIDKEVLYNNTAEWEAQAMVHLEELNRIPFDEMEREEYIAWRVWSAICKERSAFKFDVFDAPVVLKGEEDETD